MNSENFYPEETEHMLLGALLNKPDLVAVYNPQPEWFFSQENQSVCEVICTQFSQGMPVTARVIGELLVHKGYGEDIRSFVVALQANVVTMVQSAVDGWVNLIRDSHSRRTTRAAVDEFLEQLKDRQKPYEDSLGFLMQAMGSTNAGLQIRSHGEVLKDVSNRLNNPKPCYSTGFPRLDAAMAGGLYEGFTYGISAPEKVGKTTIAHTMSYQITVPHLYVALEMGSTQIEEKNIARDINLNSLAFLSKTRGVLIKDVMGVAENANRFYVDAPSATWGEIKFAIQKAKIQKKIKGFIIDYWQLVGGRGRNETEEYHLRLVAQQIADFARKEKLWCIILAQANKDGEIFAGGGLVKACDMLMFLRKTKTDSDNQRFIHMRVSRYTERIDIGSDDNPAYYMNTKAGPHFEEIPE